MKATRGRDGLIHSKQSSFALQSHAGPNPPFYADRWERDLIDYNNGNELILSKTGAGWLSVRGWTL